MDIQINSVKITLTLEEAVKLKSNLNDLIKNLEKVISYSADTSFGEILNDYPTVCEFFNLLNITVEPNDLPF